jgi:hypothetical protein
MWVNILILQKQRVNISLWTSSLLKHMQEVDFLLWLIFPLQMVALEVMLTREWNCWYQFFCSVRKIFVWIVLLPCNNHIWKWKA